MASLEQCWRENKGIREAGQAGHDIFFHIVSLNFIYIKYAITVMKKIINNG